MTEYLTSGSAVERAFQCEASVVLPRASFTSEYTQRGTMIHAFLESCAKVGRDAALVQIDEVADRDVCAEIDLSGLDFALSLAAEVAIAYDVETDKARELGRGAGRAYADVRASEIPCTLDIVGVRVLPDGVRRGLVIDWKTSHKTRDASEVLQLDFGALAAARAYDLDVVEVQLIFVYEGFPPHVSRRVIQGFEIDAFAEELRDKHRRWSDLRRGIGVVKYHVGPWCDQCASREWCEAQTSLLRSVLAKDLFDGVLRSDPIPDAALADAWRQIGAAQSILTLVKNKVLGVAGTRPILLGTDPDGSEHWIGPVLTEGKDKIDGEAAYDVIARLHNDEVATAATRVTATKKDIDAAIGAVSPRGTKAGNLRAVYGELKATGGITNSIGVRVKEWTAKPGIGAPEVSAIAESSTGTPEE